MKEQEKTQQVLVQELAALKQRVGELEQAESEWKREKENFQKSETRFQSYFNLPFYGIAITSPEQRWIRVNDRLCSIMGYSRDEIIRLTWTEMTHPEDLAADLEQFGRVLSGQIDHYNMEKRFIRKDGKVIWTSLSVGCVRKSDGGVDHIVALVEDITSVKRSEEALRENEEKYRILFENTNEAIFVVQNAKLVFINPVTPTMIGYSTAELISRPFMEFIHSEDREMVYGMHVRRMKGEELPHTYSFRVIHKDGNVLWVELNAVLIQWEGKPATLNFLSNITERRRMEAALRESENKYRFITEKMTDIVWIQDMNLRTVYVSPSVEMLLGFTPEERVLQDVAEQLTPASMSLVLETMTREFALEQQGQVDPERTLTFELEYYHKDGSTRWLESIISGIRDDRGVLTGLHGVSRDITDRRRAQEALTQSEEKFRKAFYTSPDALSITRLEDGMYISINPGFTRILGYTEEDIVGKTSIELNIWNNIADRKRLLEELRRDGTVANLEAVFRMKGGGVRYGLMSASVIDLNDLPHIISITRDITDRKESIEKLRRTLEATVQAMAVTVESRDPYTAGHQRRVADLARAIAAEMNLSPDRIDGIMTAAIVHDLGRICVAAEILSKPTGLTNLEFELIKTHPQAGYDILKDIEFPWPIARMILEHHERMDGSGYPGNLKGDEILMEARILAVSDVVESMGSHRPYRPTLGMDAALEEIERNRGTFYDPDVVDACLRIFRDKGYQLQW